jgi:hypothetical protein
MDTLEVRIPEPLTVGERTRAEAERFDRLVEVHGILDRLQKMESRNAATPFLSRQERKILDECFWAIYQLEESLRRHVEED